MLLSKKNIAKNKHCKKVHNNLKIERWNGKHNSLGGSLFGKKKNISWDNFEKKKLEEFDENATPRLFHSLGR